MLLINNSSIEDLVCAELQRGPIESTLLIEQIKKLRPNTTKQGVYAVLRQLRNAEVIVIHNKKVSFNVRWLKQVDQFFAVAAQNYTEGDLARDNFLNLKDGEKISYSFNSPTETDAFWGHALIVLAESNIPVSEPVYLYNPHEWFLIARQESERECIAIITKQRRFLLTAGSRTPLDKAVHKEFDDNMSQYEMLERSLFKKNNYYVNIVGDFLIEARIDLLIASQIDTLYRQTEKLDDGVVIKLKKIVGGKGRSKLSISRNSTKAEKIKKLLRKSFHISTKGIGIAS